MSGFDPGWLDLREAADRRARDHGLLAALAADFAGREAIEVVDLGCGTGANLRATALRLPHRQRWRLVDHDPALLEAARARLVAWADAVEEAGAEINLVKDQHEVSVAFMRADLVRDLDRALGVAPDLVTASALFDLASPAWIARLAEAVASRGAALYAVLTYDGRAEWEPPHPTDGAVLAAFHAHQHRDKGFGSAAGPEAAESLAQACAAAGYRVEVGNSPWHLGDGDAVLMAETARGIAAAAVETGAVSAEAAADWLAARSTAARGLIGHADLLARPR